MTTRRERRVDVYEAADQLVDACDEEAVHVLRQRLSDAVAGARNVDGFVALATCAHDLCEKVPDVSLREALLMFAQIALQTVRVSKH